MSVFKSVLRLNVKKSIQYRTAAISGFITQVCFGFMQIALFTAFLDSGNSDFTIKQMASYIWLQQIFFTMFKYWDCCKQEITMKITSGDIAYELIRPINLYDNWFQVVFSKPLGNFLLRGVPMIAFALLLPQSLGLMLPISIENFLLFIATILISSVLVCAINVLAYIVMLYTLSPSGIFSFIVAVGGFLSGSVVPIPMLPKYLANILNFLPFRYVNDLPYRIYIGHINGMDALIQIAIQITWTIALILIGRLIIRRKIKNIVVQGG